MKTCPVCQRKFANKQALKQHMDTVHSGKPVKQRSGARIGGGSVPPRVSGNDAVIRVARSELFASVSGDQGRVEKIVTEDFYPQNGTIRILKKFSDIYETYIVRSVSVRFITASRSTRNGQVILAYDLNSATTAAGTKAEIYSYPHVVCAIHQNSPVLKVPISNIVRYVAASDKARDKPFKVIIYVNYDNTDPTSLIGDVIVDYDIEFRGLSP